MTVVVQDSSGDRLAAKESVAVKVVAQFLQEAEHIGDAADCGQGQGALLLVKEGYGGETGTITEEQIKYKVFCLTWKQKSEEEVWAGKCYITGDG